MKNGDFVEIQYIGKIKDTGKIFDVTDETKAKQANIYNEGNKYEPVKIIVGAGHVIRGLDESLLDIEVGETKTFDIPPEKGFGKRDRPFDPVSYTHLRAHETPEHLVCRLLLEKKKKN